MKKKVAWTIFVIFCLAALLLKSSFKPLLCRIVEQKLENTISQGSKWEASFERWTISKKGITLFGFNATNQDGSVAFSAERLRYKKSFARGRDDLVCSFLDVRLTNIASHFLLQTSRPFERLVNLTVDEGRCSIIEEGTTVSFAFKMRPPALPGAPDEITIYPGPLGKEGSVNATLWTDKEKTFLTMKPHEVDVGFLADIISLFWRTPLFRPSDTAGMLSGEAYFEWTKKQPVALSMKFNVSDLHLHSAPLAFDAGLKEGMIDLYWQKGGQSDTSNLEVGFHDGHVVFFNRSIEEEYTLSSLSGRAHFSSLQDAHMLLRGNLLEGKKAIPLLLEGSSNMLSSNRLDFDLDFLLDPQENITTKLNVSVRREEEEKWQWTVQMHEISREQIAVIKHLVGYFYKPANDFELESDSFSAEIGVRMHRQKVDRVVVSELCATRFSLGSHLWQFRFDAPLVRASTRLDLEKLPLFIFPSWTIEISDGSLVSRLPDMPLSVRSLNMKLNLMNNMFSEATGTCVIAGEKVDVALKGLITEPLVRLSADAALFRSLIPLENVSGKVTVEGILNGKEITGAVIGERVTFTHAAVEVISPTAVQGNFRFDTESHDFTCRIPFSGVTLIEKNLGLVFSPTEATLIYEKNRLQLQNARAVFYDIDIAGDFALNFADPIRLQLDLDLYEVNGDLHKAQDVFDKIRPNWKIPGQLSGKVGGKENSFGLHMVFPKGEEPEVDWNIHAELSELKFLTGEKLYLQQGECVVDAAHGQNAIFFSRMKGNLGLFDVPLLSIRVPFVCLGLSGPIIDFSLRGEVGTAEMAFLDGSFHLKERKLTLKETSRIFSEPFVFAQDEKGWTFSAQGESVPAFVIPIPFLEPIFWGGGWKAEIARDRFDLQIGALVCRAEKKEDGTWNFEAEAGAGKRCAGFFDSEGALFKEVEWGYGALSGGVRILQLCRQGAAAQGITWMQGEKWSGEGSLSATYDASSQCTFFTTTLCARVKSGDVPYEIRCDDFNMRYDFSGKLELFRGQGTLSTGTFTTPYSISDLTYAGRVLECRALLGVLSIELFPVRYAAHPLRFNEAHDVTVGLSLDFGRGDLTLELDSEKGDMLVNAGPIGIKHLKLLKEEDRYSFHGDGGYFDEPFSCEGVWDGKRLSLSGRPHFKVEVDVAEQRLDEIECALSHLSLSAVPISAASDGAKRFSASLRGSLAKWSPYLSEDWQKLITMASLNSGLEIKGVLTLPLADPWQFDFTGKLFGSHFDAFGLELATLASDFSYSHQLLTLSNFILKDEAIRLKIKEMQVFSPHLGASRIHIPEMVFSGIRPSKFARKGGKKMPPDPFIIRTMVIHDVEGVPDNLTTIRGRGTLMFTNTPEKKSNLFLFPFEIVKRIGLDPNLLVPVRGEMDFILRDGKMIFTKLKNSVSAEKRSYFYLSNRGKSYVDFDGNMNITIKMKQHVLFRIAELFSLSLSGTVEKPVYALK